MCLIGSDCASAPCVVNVGALSLLMVGSAMLMVVNLRDNFMEEDADDVEGKKVRRKEIEGRKSYK